MIFFLQQYVDLNRRIPAVLQASGGLEGDDRICG